MSFQTCTLSWFSGRYAIRFLRRFIPMASQDMLSNQPLLAGHNLWLTGYLALLALQSIGRFDRVVYPSSGPESKVLSDA